MECPIKDHKENGKLERLIRTINERLRANKKIINRSVLQSEYFNILKSERDRRNLTNESRNSKRMKTEIFSLKNSFGDIVTDQKRIANLLNCRFSKLGEYFGQTRQYMNTTSKDIQNNNRKFSLQPKSTLECRKHLNRLNKNNSLGPSDIASWALKDCLTLLAEPLCFIINAFIEEGKFPEHLKQAHVIPIYKKGDNDDPDNYRPTNTLKGTKYCAHCNLGSEQTVQQRMHYYSLRKT